MVAMESHGHGVVFAVSQVGSTPADEARMVLMTESGRPLIGITALTAQLKDIRAYGASASYVEAIRAHGGLPVLLPPGNADLAENYLDALSGLLIPGGTDVDPALYGEQPHQSILKLDPELDRFELRLIRLAFDRDLPILAICRGIQSLAVALGGTLIQDLPTERPGLSHEVREHGRQFLAHEVSIDGGCRLAAILGTNRVAVNTLHHQAVRVMPQGMTATGWADDETVEAAEAPAKRFVIAVQWHPEELWNTTATQQGRLFQAFVDACRVPSASGLQPVADSSLRAATAATTPPGVEEAAVTTPLMPAARQASAVRRPMATALGQLRSRRPTA